MIEIYLLSLGLTLILELGYAWLWGVKSKDYWLITAMNVLTNPLVVLWHYTFLEQEFLINTVLPEIAAVVTECFLLSKFGKNIRKPVMLGVCINVFSYFVGLLINLFIL